MLFEVFTSVFVGARRDAPVFKEGRLPSRPYEGIGAKNAPSGHNKTSTIKGCV